ncbi:MAG: adenosylmethionine decarboxylase proenzyme [Dehalococcoidia bacterium]|nr:adenosylmethionine decarboxylase proenzyme [Dehalococcoidia bacterium]
MHLIIDGNGSDPSILKDEKFIRNLLDTYPGKIGMTKISPPYITHYMQGKPDDWGVSGFVFIAESHISIHTFEVQGTVNIDIFSCKDFDAQRVIEDLRQTLHLTHFRTQLLDRDLKPIKLPEELASRKV